MRRLFTLFAAVMLGGCASTPAPLKGSFASVTPRAVEGAGAGQASQQVRWGGSIVNTVPQKAETCFTVVAHPLDNSGRPKQGDKTQGRFIACAKGFYEPEVYARGREITVVGRLAGIETKDIGGYSYRYPKVQASTVYLWSKETRASYPVYPYYASPYSFYYPYSYPYSYPFIASPFYQPLYGGGLFPYSMYGLPPLYPRGHGPGPRRRKERFPDKR